MKAHMNRKELVSAISSLGMLGDTNVVRLVFAKEYLYLCVNERHANVLSDPDGQWDPRGETMAPCKVFATELKTAVNEAKGEVVYLTYFVRSMDDDGRHTAPLLLVKGSSHLSKHYLLEVQEGNLPPGNDPLRVYRQKLRNLAAKNNEKETEDA